MFGTKLRTWMEAHIVRSKKKKDRKKGSEKGFDSNCNSPRSHSANRSPALHQVHPVDSPTKNVNGIRLHGDGSYSGTVTTSSGTSGTSGGTGSVNLSSPESAYSTGYSTDGTSPGTSFPPEYYINIRTGTHYFQSNDNGRPQRPADAAGNGKLGDRTERTNLANMTGDEKQTTRDFGTSIPDKSAEDTGNHRSRHSQQQQQQQQQQTQHRQAQQENHRRRTGSFSADPTKSNGPSVPSSIPPPLVSPPVQSPRERSRIRTNPWLSANSSGSSTAGFKSRLALDESSGSSGLKLTESSGSASDVNANGTREGHARREYRQESLSAGRSPINHNWRLASGMDVRGKIGALGMQQRRPMSSSSGSNSNSNVSNGTNSAGSSPASSMTHSARSSEDDITLNEMMGKFDESYVYEKETDILSDSDPTDCEDYVDSLSDVDAGQDAGDENDPLENDDLDYIDNGSFLDLEDLECSTHIPNTGHCTYFTFGNELARRAGTRPRDSLTKRRNKDDTVPQRMVSVRNGAKRQSGRHKKPEEKQQGEKRKKRMSQRRKLNSEKCDDETANLNRVLVERMLLKNSGFNQGSRSVGGTPICLRRKKHDVNKNLSPTMPNDDRSTTPRPMTVVESEIVKRRSNSVSYVNGNVVSRQITGNAYMTTFASEIALIEADKEADRKYRELILEAENILVNMQKSQNNSSSAIVPSPSRKFHNGLANKRVELIKNTELNIELALSKSRNSQPELQSGSIRDLEHTSPKRQFFAQPCSPIHRFMERSSASGVGGGSNGGGCGSNSGFLPKETSYRQEQHQQQQQGGGKCRSPDSPAVSRRTPPRQSPNRSLVRHPRPRIGADGSAEGKEQQRGGPPRMTSANCNGISRTDVDVLPLLYAQSPFRSKAHAVLSRTESAAVSLFGNGRDNHHHRAFRTAKEDGTFATSSSSDSEERCDVGRRAPLMTFRSIDMGPIKETSSYCPQSEPVKRKVYAGSATYGRIQKTLGEHVMLRNSDGDTATDDTDDSRRSLKEKVALLRQERLAAEANANSQDSQTFQHQLSQLRRQMLMQTIEGLKRSLEDQSATLKQTCLESVLADCELP